jgi:hypothetical protein
MVAAVVVSVRLGRRSANGRRRKLAVLANVAIGGALVVAVLTTHPGGYRVEYIDNGPPSFEGYLQAPDGRPIFNIYPFAADGTPLDGVLLYDQDGMPLDNLSPLTRSGVPVVPLFPIDARGASISNAYPRSVQIAGTGPDQRPHVLDPPRPNTPTSTTVVPSSSPPTTTTPTTAPVAP